jgi:hypothetical protein
MALCGNSPKQPGNLGWTRITRIRLPQSPPHARGIAGVGRKKAQKAQKRIRPFFAPLVPLCGPSLKY